MKQIEIDFPPERKIGINGEEYEVLLSDVEVLEVASELAARFAALEGAGGTDTALETVRDAIAVLDRLLGEGAAKRIVGNRRVDAAFMLGGVILPVLKAALDTSGEAYADRIAEEYEQ